MGLCRVGPCFCILHCFKKIPYLILTTSNSILIGVGGNGDVKIGPFGDYIRGIAHFGIAFLFTGFYRGFGLMFPAWKI